MVVDVPPNELNISHKSLDHHITPKVYQDTHLRPAWVKIAYHHNRTGPHMQSCRYFFKERASHELESIQ